MGPTQFVLPAGGWGDLMGGWWKKGKALKIVMRKGG